MLFSNPNLGEILGFGSICSQLPRDSASEKYSKDGVTCRFVKNAPKILKFKDKKYPKSKAYIHITI
jgi:hypothetical protein